MSMSHKHPSLALLRNRNDFSGSARIVAELKSVPLLLAAVLPLHLNAAPAEATPVDGDFAATAGKVFEPRAIGGISSVLVQPDGKILFGSNEMPGVIHRGQAGETQLALPLIRFNPDGSVDNVFFADNEPTGAGSGVYYDDPGWPEVHALGLLSDGKIVAAGVMQGVRTGESAADPGDHLVSNSIVRFNADGTIDSGFQTAGTTPWPGGQLNYIEHVTVQPDDKIIACGGFGGIRDSASGPTVKRPGVARFNVDGSLDVSFALNPAEFGVPAGADNIRGQFFQTALDSHGGVLIAGKLYWGPLYPPAGETVVLARLNADGSRDSTFLPVLPADLSGVSGVVVEPSGKITALGSRGANGATPWMARFAPDGTPDASFAPDPALTRIAARPLEVDPLGRYLVSTRDGAAYAENTLVRLLGDGSLDPSFEATATYVDSPVSGDFSSFLVHTTSHDGKVYTGSFFDRVNGVATVKIAAFGGDSDPDAPGVVQFAAVDWSAAESAGVLRVALTRSGGTAGGATASLALSYGSATAADLSLPSPDVTFPDGTGGTLWISLPLTHDPAATGDKTAVLQLSGVSGAAKGSRDAANLIIRDVDATPLIVRQPASLFVKPGHPFRLSAGFSSAALPLSYQWFFNGVAIPGATALVFAASAADAATHNGSYALTATNANGSVTTAAANVTVKNPAILAFAAATANVVENEGPLLLTLRRSGSDVGAVSIGVAFENLSAVSPDDYTAATATVTWADGDSADKTVSIPIIDNSTAAAAKNFRVFLTAPSADAEAGAVNSVLVTILDDDSGPVFTTPLSARRFVTGWNHELSVTVQSQTSVSFQWYHNGGLIAAADGPTLAFTPVGTEDFGYYEVHVTNSAGTVVSGPVEIGPRPNPLDPGPLDVSVQLNQFSGISARPHGGHLVYGAFQSASTSAGSVSIPRLLRTGPDGKVDPAFNLQPNITVSQAIEFPDGSMLIRGATKIGLVNTLNALALINPDGTVNDGFTANYSLTLQISYDVVPGPDGFIYIPYNKGLERIHADGTPDPAFSATLNSQLVPLYTSVGGVAFSPDGTLHLYGSFMLDDGTSFRCPLLKLNPDGSLDPTWKHAHSVNGYQSVGFQADGRIIVPGTAARTLVRLFPDGSPDPSFNTISQVFSHSVARDGSIYVVPTVGTGNTSSNKLHHYGPDGLPDVPFNNAWDASGKTVSRLNFLSDGTIGIASPGLLLGDFRRVGIIAQPSAQTVNPGDPVILSVAVASTAPLTYQWHKDGSPVAGETRSILSIPAAAAADSGHYHVVIGSPESGSLTSAAARLIVRDAPLVLSLPADHNGLAGAPLELAPEWAGAEPATFQWFRNGAVLDGETAATFSLASPAREDSGLYTLQITNARGQTTSHPVIVTITDDPTSPAGGYVPAVSGSNPNVSAILAEPGGAFLFNLSAWSSIVHPSGTYHTYLQRIRADGSISDDNGFSANVNATAFGMVRDPLSGDLLAWGSNVGATGRKLARFAATDGAADDDFNVKAAAALTAASFPTPLGAWVRHDGAILLASSSFPPRLLLLNPDGGLNTDLSANVSTLPNISRIHLLPDGKMYLLANNGLSRRLADGSPDPAFTPPSYPTSMNYAVTAPTADGGLVAANTNFADQTVYRLGPGGEIVTRIDFAYATKGVIKGLLPLPDGRLLLSHNNSPRLSAFLPDGSPDPLFDFGAGFNAAPETFALAADGSIWAGGPFTSYKGSAAYGVIRLTGLPTDMIIHTQPAAAVADDGEDANFTVGATAADDAGITYLWRKDGVPLGDGGRVSGSVTATLSLSGVTAADQGVYDVILVHEDSGRPLLSSPAGLTVLREPEILAQPASPDLEVGQTLTLEVAARGAGSPGYQWFRNGAAIAGATSATLGVAHVTEADAGSYTLRITNAYGQLDSATVTVKVSRPAGGVVFGTGDVQFWNGAVNAILPLPDGRALVAGDFNSVRVDGVSHSIQRLALLRADGTLDTSYSPNPAGSINDMLLMPDGGVLLANGPTRLNPDLSPDPSWGPTPRANNLIKTMAPAGGGGYYLGGTFTAYNGDSSAVRLCRIHEDGSLDGSFTPPALSTVNRVVADGDGLIVGGNFTILNPDAGINQLAIVRLDRNGKHDTSFRAGMQSGSVFDVVRLNDGRWLAAGTQMRLFGADGTMDASWTTNPTGGTVSRLFVQPDGLIVAAGSFTALGGQTANRIARLRPNGSLDPSFAANAGADNAINTLAADALGALHIGGNFTTCRGENRLRYARLNGVPAAFAVSLHPAPAIIEPGETAVFRAAALAEDGSTFSWQWRRDGLPLTESEALAGVRSATLTLSSPTDADADLYDVLVTHNSTGDSLLSRPAELTVLGAPEIMLQPESIATEAGLPVKFRSSARGVSPLVYQWHRNSIPLADGGGVSGATTAELTLSGVTSDAEGVYMLRVTNALGSVDSSPANLSVQSLPAGMDHFVIQPLSISGGVSDVLPLADGGYVLAGAFTSIQDPVSSGARKGVTVLDSAGIVNQSAPRIQAGSSVSRLAADDAGRIYLIGEFTSFTTPAGVKNRTRIARLESDFTLDDSFIVEGTGANNVVNALLPLPDGKVLVGGRFSSIAGKTGAAYLALLDQAGNVDDSFSASIAGGTGGVLDLAMAGDGSVWVVLAPNITYEGHKPVVRINPATGAVVPGYSLNSTTFAERIIPLPDGSAAVIGQLAFFKVDADGAVAPSWPDTAGFTGYRPTRGVALPDGRIYVGGNFTKYDNILRNKVAALHPDASLVEEFDPLGGMDPQGNHGTWIPSSMRLDSTGRLWMAGAFSEWQGHAVPGFVVLNGLDPLGSSSAWDDFTAGLPAGLKGETDDPDNDGLANLLEFALGTDPASPTAHPLAGAAAIHPGEALSGAPDPAKSYRVVEVETSLAAGGEVTLELEVSRDLSFTDGGSAVEILPRVANDATETRRYLLLDAVEDAPRLFWRLKATR